MKYGQDVIIQKWTDHNIQYKYKQIRCIDAFGTVCLTINIKRKPYIPDVFMTFYTYCILSVNIGLAADTPPLDDGDNVCKEKPPR